MLRYLLRVMSNPLHQNNCTMFVREAPHTHNDDKDDYTPDFTGIACNRVRVSDTTTNNCVSMVSSHDHNDDKDYTLNFTGGERHTDKHLREHGVVARPQRQRGLHAQLHRYCATECA
jgi:hypothetical protein